MKQDFMRLDEYLSHIIEAVNRVERYPEFANSHPEAPFAMAYGMRNMLAHGYFKVDLEVVWKTIERDLPELGALVSELAKTTSKLHNNNM